MTLPNSTTREPVIAPVEDKRLDRLLDYTKFHIGIYLSIGGGLVALIGSASKADEHAFLGKFIGSHWALAVALALMLLSGLAGGIIASCCTQFHTFEDVWNEKHGPHKLKLLKGQTWAVIEHSTFWLSLLAFGYAILSAKGVIEWLFKS